MTTSTSRLTGYLGLKVPADLDREIRRLAREDDRTVGSFVRRILSAAVAHDRRPETPEADRGR